MHRASHDIDVLNTLMWKIISDFNLQYLQKIFKDLAKQSVIPAKLTTDIEIIPEAPGVYIFYGKNKKLPLYVGKSVSIKQRILSHFQADHTHAKEFALAQKVEHIETIQTAGELSALLLESKLIKKYNPVYNRRLRRKKQLVGFIMGSQKEHEHNYNEQKNNHQNNDK